MQKFITSAVRRLADWAEFDAALENTHPKTRALLAPTVEEFWKRYERVSHAGEIWAIWDDVKEEIERRKAQRVISIKFKIARAQKAKELAELDAALTA